MLPETPARRAARGAPRSRPELIRRYLGRECIGAADAVRLLPRPARPARPARRSWPETGHRFVTSWGRNEENGNPTPWVQPFAYAEEGFPDLLEIPFQFWLDGVWFDANGYDQGARVPPRRSRARSTRSPSSDLVFATAFHEWCAVEADEEGTGWIRGLIEHARERGVEITSYADYWAGRPASQAPATTDRHAQLTTRDDRARREHRWKT